MNKLKPKYKINLQLREIISVHVNLERLKKKKWQKIKKNFEFTSRNKKPFSQNTQLKPEKRKSFFNKRFLETQKLKFFYGCLSEYQLKNYFKKVNKKKNKGNLFQKLLVLLESCLDITLVRLRVAKTIFEAKQLINHKKIKVNDQIINQPKYTLRQGDIITTCL